MDQKSKDRHRCIVCGMMGLPRLVEGRKVKCKYCGQVHTVHFTANGNLMLTDDRFSNLIQKGGRRNMNNQERFEELMSIAADRPGWSELMNYIQKSDFYTAPASSRFHLAAPEDCCSIP